MKIYTLNLIMAELYGTLGIVSVFLIEEKIIAVIIASLCMIVMIFFGLFMVIEDKTQQIIRSIERKNEE